MKTIADIIYQISTSLLLPVLVSLVVLLSCTLFALGSLLGEWLSRRRHHACWQKLLATARVQRIEALTLTGPVRDYSWIVPLLPRALDNDDATAVFREKCLAEMEVRATGRLAWMNFGIRTGPLLGLMGTLIPMGPALVGLSDGSFQSVSENLVIAFATTVIGVLIGALCYGMWLIRRQWYGQDLVDAQFLIGQCIERQLSAVNDGEVTSGNAYA
ncbi:MAG: MotA/TolQ/ExbB proton channel family protein [Pirellulaceae bacterium]|nr:MotA/TolQ/ExbB proton channel family protein [Planctomycetales bacterium]